MDCAFLIYQSKNDAIAGTALLEVAGYGEDGPYLLAHLHDLGSEVTQGGGAAVLGFGVAVP